MTTGPVVRPVSPKVARAGGFLGVYRTAYPNELAVRVGEGARDPTGPCWTPFTVQTVPEGAYLGITVVTHPQQLPTGINCPLVLDVVYAGVPLPHPFVDDVVLDLRHRRLVRVLPALHLTADGLLAAAQPPATTRPTGDG